jgi:hypothetical protein
VRDYLFKQRWEKNIQVFWDVMSFRFHSDSEDGSSTQLRNDLTSCKDPILKSHQNNNNNNNNNVRGTHNVQGNQKYTENLGRKNQGEELLCEKDGLTTNLEQCGSCRKIITSLQIWRLSTQH